VRPLAIHAPDYLSEVFVAGLIVRWQPKTERALNFQGRSHLRKAAFSIHALFPGANSPAGSINFIDSNKHRISAAVAQIFTLKSRYWRDADTDGKLRCERLGNLLAIKVQPVAYLLVTRARAQSEKSLALFEPIISVTKHDTNAITSFICC
jgi:hypothetical protein